MNDVSSNNLWKEFRRTALKSELRACCKAIMDFGIDGIQLFRVDENNKLIGEINNLFINYCPHCGNYLKTIDDRKNL